MKSCLWCRLPVPTPRRAPLNHRDRLLRASRGAGRFHGEDPLPGQSANGYCGCDAIRLRGWDPGIPGVLAARQLGC